MILYNLVTYGDLAYAFHYQGEDWPHTWNVEAIQSRKCIETFKDNPWYVLGIL